MRGSLITHLKVIEDDGNIVETKMWKVKSSPNKPHGYKYSLAYIVKGKRVIGYDNAEGKGDHRHYGEKTEVYIFRNIRALVEDFYKDIERYKEGKT